VTAPALLVLLVSVGGGTLFLMSLRKPGGAPTWHRIVEGRATIFTALTVLAVLAGGIAEIVPALIVAPPPLKPGEAGPRVLSALELEGRDIYLREGCYGCHSQMIRPLAFETLRYGDASTLADSQFDHPFQWGSKRTGPDLAREGGKNPHAWHAQHFMDPRAITVGSNMPSYAHFATEEVAFEDTGTKMRALRSVGVPFTPAEIESAAASAQKQGESIAIELAEQGTPMPARSEMVAMIAYLQALGVTAPLEAPPPVKPIAAAH